MRSIFVTIMALVLMTANVWAQVDLPEVDVPEVPDTEVPDVPEAPDETEVPDETETEDPLPGANLSEQQRVSRLAEASGKTEAEIYALRYGRTLETGEGSEAVDGEAIAGKTQGWGQVVKELGLHPGILGHGTGNKFMPELPEIDSEVLGSVRTARERARERKTERKETKAQTKADRRDAKADKVRGKSADKGKPNKPEKDPKGKK